MFTINTYPDGVVCERSGMISARHAFSTRYGGVSTLPHLVSMNLGEGRGDDPRNVAENYNRLLSHMGRSFSDTVRAGQIHSTNIRYVTEDDRGRFFADTDGFITDRAGVVLVSKVADCAPILLFEKERGVIAAVHAGWRGAASGIAAVAVSKMCKMGCRAENIKVAIGSCIHSCCFEVKDDFVNTLTDLCGVELARLVVSEREGRLFADNVRLNVEMLRSVGVPLENIDISPSCTKCHPERYFSHRASAGLRGTMAAVITL